MKQSEESDGVSGKLGEVSENIEDYPVNPTANPMVWKLYLSRLLTAWGDRLWSFGFGLFLFRMHSTDLSLVAGYGLAMSLSNILFLANVGTWIDKTSRLIAARTLLFIQNLCVVLDCVMLALYFCFNKEILNTGYSWLPSIIAIVISVCALVANIASHGSKIIIERDWVVVVSGGDNNRLANLNSNFRTIDLSCNTLAPILAGLLFSKTTYFVAAVAIGSWNLISVILEYLLLNAIYKEYPELSHKKALDDAQDVKEKNWFVERVTGSYKGWISYVRHDVRFAGLGLALLYMTVLGFDNITWGYSLLQCVPEWVLGVLVAVSGFMGILGTRVFPFLRKHCGIERAGVTGMILLVLSISLPVVSIWLPGSPFDLTKVDDNNVTTTASEFSTTPNATLEQICEEGETQFISVSVMLAGIIVARFGLWIADLSISQIFQENVEEEKRGVIGGVQTSLNSFFDLVKFVFVLFLPDSHTFGILIILSFTFVSSGAISLTCYAAKKKKLCCQGGYDKPVNQDLEKPEL